MLRKFYILSVILLLGFAVCQTNGFADDDDIPVEDNFDFPTADGAGYIQGNAEYQKIPDKIIGTADFEKMRDLPRASQDYQLGTQVGWIVIPKRNEPGRNWICTGFLVGPDLFMTNHHCLHDDKGLLSLADAKIYMDYYQDDDVDPTFGGITARVTEIVRMHQYKDYALLRLDTPIGNTYGWLELDTRRSFNTSQRVKIIQHPDARSKEIDRRYSRIVDIPSWHPLKAYGNTRLGYLADTEGGSSGSPVFLRGGTSVIAIHNSGWGSFNAGVLMSYIIPGIRKWLPTSPPPPRATTLEKVSGDNQSARINSQLPNPLVVRVLDQNGAVLPGVSVNFSVSPNGTLTPEADTTDSSGLAETHLTFGGDSGQYTVTANVPGPSAPVTFTATATQPPPRATTLEKVSGDNQSATINSQLPNPLVVRVLDQNGAALPGVSVNFSVDNQNAEIDAQLRNSVIVRVFEDQSGAVLSDAQGNVSVTTNNRGLAETRLTLGSTLGEYSVTTSVSGITEPVTFTATATEPPKATTLEKVSGNNQSATINSQLPNPFVVRVLDQNGAALPGVSVNFSVSPSGTLTPEAGTTDGSGLAETRLTLGGDSGSYSVTASVSGITQPITFTVTATKPPPPPVTRRATTLEKVSGDNQSARINTRLSNPFVVRVLDQNGAVLSGTTVNFSVSPSGTLTSSTDATNNRGLAETRLRFSNTSGQHTITASVSGITESVTFTATATKPPPPPVTRRATTLEKVSGDNQSARINAQLANPFVVRVLDQNGAVLSGTTVNFSVSPSGTLTSSTDATNNRGLAETRLRFSNTSGQHTITASVSGIAESVTFTATATEPPPPPRATTLEKVSGDNQSARINTRLSNPFVVRVLDQNGAVLSGTTVEFSVRPSATLTPQTDTTNNSGLAETHLTLGGDSGQYTVTANVSGITESVTFTGTATEPPPQSVPITFHPSVIDDLTLTVNIAIEPLDMPLAEGGTPTYVYTLDPIPTGLFFSEVIRELSGTPTIVKTTTTTYTATDAKGETNALTFTIEVIENITQPENPLDVDGDGEITVIDLTIVALFYGTQVPTGINLPADVNADNVVDLLDLTAVAQGLDAAGELSELSNDEIAALLEAATQAATLKVIADAPINHNASQHALNVAAALSSTKRLVTDDIRFGKKLETVLLYLLQTFTKKGAIPETTVLLPNYPNPFNPETWIPYTLSASTNVIIEIHTANGSLVRRLNIGHQPAGFYVNKTSAAYWDGRNMMGEPVASGLYFYSLIAGDYAETKKMLIRR